MLTAKLYVGNIGRWMTEPELRALFSPGGDVLLAHVVTHDLTGKSCGFGYVEMGSDDQARDAVTRLHRLPVSGLPLIVRPVEVFPDREWTCGPAVPKKGDDL